MEHSQDGHNAGEVYLWVMVNYIDLIIHDSMSSVTFNEMLIAYSSMDRWCPLGPSYSYNPMLKPRFIPYRKAVKP